MIVLDNTNALVMTLMKWLGDATYFPRKLGITRLGDISVGLCKQIVAMHGQLVTPQGRRQLGISLPSTFPTFSWGVMAK